MVGQGQGMMDSSRDQRGVVHRSSGERGKAGREVAIVSPSRQGTVCVGSPIRSSASAEAGRGQRHRSGGGHTTGRGARRRPYPVSGMVVVVVHSGPACEPVSAKMESPQSHWGPAHRGQAQGPEDPTIGTEATKESVAVIVNVDTHRGGSKVPAPAGRGRRPTDANTPHTDGATASGGDARAQANPCCCRGGGQQGR